VIVIPMAGQSGRFARAGYDVPKYMLDARGRSLFAHALSSFSNEFGRQKILLACRDVAGTRDFLDTELAKLGLGEGEVEISMLDAPTSGQAETVAQALRRSGVDGAEPLTVFNIDTFRPGFRYPPNLDLAKIDGFLEVFRGEGEHWSFVRPEDPAADSGRAVEVTEKVRVSDLCSTGLYYFRSVDFFLSLYAEVENADTGGLEGGERYVAPLYAIALKRGADIRYQVIGRDEVTFCGTPDEYDAYRKMPPTEAKIAFCISGQVRGSKSILRDIADLAEEVGADVFLSVWQKRGRKTFVGVTGPWQLSRIVGDVPTQMLPRAFHYRMHVIFPDIDRRLTAVSEDVYDDVAEVFPNAVIDIEAPILDLDLDTESQDKNSLRMLYKFWRCNRLKRKAEADRGYRYETVVRFRPDILPDVEAHQKMAPGPKTVALPIDKSRERYLDDLFWICDSQTDDYLSSLFGAAVLAPHRRWSYIHRELYDHAIAGGLHLRHIAPKKGIVQDAPESDRAMVTGLIAAALIQKTCTLPDGFSERSADLLGRLMQLQARAPDLPDALDAIVEISQSSDDVSILKAALLAAVDHQREAPAEDLCACILAAGVLLAIECNATADYPLRIPDLSKFLDAWKERLSAVDDLPSVLDLEAGKGAKGDTLLQMASHACDLARERIGQDALSKTVDSLMAHVNAHNPIVVLRVLRTLGGPRDHSGDADGLLADIRRAIELSPKNWRLWARLIKLEMASGRRWETAGAVLKSLRLVVPNLVRKLRAAISG
jgi:hypothetical protein